MRTHSPEGGPAGATEGMHWHPQGHGRTALATLVPYAAALAAPTAAAAAAGMAVPARLPVPRSAAHQHHMEAHPSWWTGACCQLEAHPLVVPPSGVGIAVGQAAAVEQAAGAAAAAGEAVVAEVAEVHVVPPAPASGAPAPTRPPGPAPTWHPTCCCLLRPAASTRSLIALLDGQTRSTVCTLQSCIRCLTLRGCTQKMSAKLSPFRQHT